MPDDPQTDPALDAGGEAPLRAGGDEGGPAGERVGEAGDLAEPQASRADKHRAVREHWEAKAAQHPAWAGFVKIEEARERKLAVIRLEYLKLHKKKEK